MVLRRRRCSRKAGAVQGTYLDLAVNAVLRTRSKRRARSAPEKAHAFPLTWTLIQLATGRYAPGAAGEAPGAAIESWGE
jgi:hypothetical protein